MGFSADAPPSRRQAGLPGLYPHQLRHTFAHEWLVQGGGDTDLMRLAGWKSRAMLQRDGARPLTPAPARHTADCLPPTGSEDDERLLIKILHPGLLPRIAPATWANDRLRP